MPDDVSDAIESARLKTAYANRPPYQRNDYIGWIDQAKADETRQSRIEQMLDELRRGDVYMKMTWKRKD